MGIKKSIELSGVFKRLDEVADYSFELVEEKDKNGNSTGNKRFMDPSSGLKACELLCKFLSSETPKEGNKPVINCVKGLDGEAI